MRPDESAVARVLIVRRCGVDTRQTARRPWRRDDYHRRPVWQQCLPSETPATAGVSARLHPDRYRTGNRRTGVLSWSRRRSVRRSRCWRPRSTPTSPATETPSGPTQKPSRTSETLEREM